jgi:hypothetical protein
MVQCENFLSTFPYGSMLKLCPAMVAILDFNQQKNPHTLQKTNTKSNFKPLSSFLTIEL